MRRRLRTPLAVASFTAAVLLLPHPAAAHVEPEVSTVPAGAPVEVAFTVEHGCDGSPTVKLEFQVPDAVTDARPLDKEGWTGAVVDGVITYTGGSLPDDEPSDFGIGFTAPTTVGETIRFPMIQTCEEGQLDWIQDGADATRPAPAVEIGEPDPTATTVPTTAAETTTTPADPDGEAGAPSTTAVPADETTTSTTTPDATDTEDEGSSALVPALIAAAVVVLGGGGFLAYRMRRDASSS